jgi:hypothetical protein
MQSPQPMASPLGVLLLVAAVVLIVRSPRKLRTLGWMAVAFLATALLVMLTNAILRIGDPEAWGRIAGLVALLAAVIAGWWHTRSLKRTTETPAK